MKDRKNGNKKKDLYALVRYEERKQRREHLSFWDQLLEKASLTADLSGEPWITLTGNYGMLVRNYNTISSYTESGICLKVHGMLLLIEGKDLFLEYSVKDELRIGGLIHKIEFRNEMEET